MILGAGWQGCLYKLPHNKQDIPTYRGSECPVQSVRLADLASSDPSLMRAAQTPVLSYLLCGCWAAGVKANEAWCPPSLCSQSSLGKGAYTTGTVCKALWGQCGPESARSPGQVAENCRGFKGHWSLPGRGKEDIPGGRV